MSAQGMSGFANLVLGESVDPVAVDGSAENRAAVLAMVAQAQRSLEIVTRDLDAPVYDDAEVVEAIKGLVLGSRQSRVRILINDTTRIVQQGHRLLELVRRLSSFMEMRVPAREHQAYNSAFLVADRTGTVYRSHADRYDGSVCFNDLRGADELIRQFEEMWEVAEVPAALRRFTL